MVEAVDVLEHLLRVDVVVGGDREVVGVDQLVFGLPNNLQHDEALECIELFGDKVIPNWDQDPVHRTTRMRQTAKPKFGPFEHEPPAIETIFTQGLA